MLLNQSAKTPFYQFDNLRNLKDILHFATTRHGGVSTGNWGSLNMDFTDDDTSENVLENRHRIAQAVGFTADAFTFANQMHTANITIVTADMRGAGYLNTTTRIPNCDALVTNVADICLIAKTADCVPIILCDPIKRVIASVHAGWRGTVQQITRKTVDCMVTEFCSHPSDILVGIGASIGACCYEVGDDVVMAVKQSFGSTKGFLVDIKGKQKKHLDLWYANRYQLEQAGVPTQNIETACLCTSCRSDEFFSWRRSGTTTGRLATGIILKN